MMQGAYSNSIGNGHKTFNLAGVQETPTLRLDKKTPTAINKLNEGQECGNTRLYEQWCLVSGGVAHLVEQYKCVVNGTNSNHTLVEGSIPFSPIYS